MSQRGAGRQRAELENGLGQVPADVLHPVPRRWVPAPPHPRPTRPTRRPRVRAADPARRSGTREPTAAPPGNPRRPAPTVVGLSRTHEKSVSTHLPDRHLVRGRVPVTTVESYSS